MKKAKTASRKAKKTGAVIDTKVPKPLMADLQALAKQLGIPAREAARLALKQYTAKQLTDEQKGWLALELLDAPKRKRAEQFCRKLGVGPQHLIREQFEGLLGSHVLKSEGLNHPDFIVNVLQEAGKL
jgi:hypothetical protein